MGPGYVISTEAVRGAIGITDLPVESEDTPDLSQQYIQQTGNIDDNVNFYSCSECNMLKCLVINVCCS